MNLILKRIFAEQLADKYCIKCYTKSIDCRRTTYSRSQIVNEIITFSTPEGKDLKEENLITTRFSCFSKRKD